MRWSPQQDKALRDVSRWLKNPTRQVYRLFGFAGTGKTTLARHLAEGVDGRVLFAAYTGKAASVLRAAGCPNAQTLHSLIYTSKHQSQARLRELEAQLVEATDGRDATDPDNFPAHVWEAIARIRRDLEIERNNLKRPAFQIKTDSDLSGASLLVIDECSMVDQAMADDIMGFQVPVLVLGDPAQLPPVFGTGVLTDHPADTMLTEIHRQAKDNPIINMATTIREGGHLHWGTYGDSCVIKRASPEQALAADQVLVGKNKTRMASNRRVRELRGLNHTPWPLKGERLVCLRNNRQVGLLNGTIHVCVEDAVDTGDYLSMRVQPEDGGEGQVVSAHKQHFAGDPDEIGNWERLDAEEFTYGYALTVHKAQGSQWQNVMLFDEWFQRDTRQRWLYTAITRAAQTITVVRGER